MTELQVQRHIAAPAEQVWEMVCDLESAARTMAAIDKVEHVSGPYPRIGVGTVWDETRTMMRRSETQRMRCTAIDEAAMRYTVETDGHGAHYHSVMAVDGDGAGCTISMSFAADAQTTAAKVLSVTVGRLFEGATRKALATDLDDIARAAVG